MLKPCFLLIFSTPVKECVPSDPSQLRGNLLLTAHSFVSGHVGIDATLEQLLVLSFCYFSFFQQHQVFASVTYVQFELYNSSDCASSGLQGFKIVALDGDCVPAPNNPTSGNLYNCGSGTVQNWLVDSLTCTKTFNNLTFTTLPMTTCYSVEKEYSAVNSTLYYKYSCKNGVVVGEITSSTQTCSQLSPNSYGNTLSYYPEGTCYNEISITTPPTASSFIPSVASASTLVFVNGTMVSKYTW